MGSASERIEVARALHDGLAQDLVALRFRTEFLADSPAIGIAESRELRKLALEISQLTEKVRRELFNLRDRQPLDFLTALEALLNSYQSEINVELKSSFEAISDDLGQLILDITPELIRNTLNHAGASRIDIAIAQMENSLQFTFSDDGKGGAHEGGLRYGLTGVRESVELCGGTFTLIDKGGTEICLNFPNERSS
jgi:NarL family two-component system sensor histidine kinase LiaS